MKDLKKKTVEGVIWKTGSQAVNELLRFGISVTLARILFPHDFGTMAAAAIFFEAVSSLSDLGMGAAIIRIKRLEPQHLSTAFWSNVGVGLLVAAAGALSAPYVASFFRNDDLGKVMPFVAMGFLIGSFSMVHSVQLTRNMDFRLNAMIRVAGTAVSGVVSISMALGGYSFWSLVWGNLASHFFMVATRWIILPWRPSLEFSVRHFKELFGFGAYTLGTSFLADICLNVDTFLVSRFLGASSLGVYSMARNVSTFPVRRMADVVKAVMYPAFAKVQDETNRIQRAYLKNLSYVGLVTFPMLAGLSMVSQDFVPFVYGERWSGAAGPLRILCGAALLRTITINFGTIFRVTGRPEIDLRLQVFRLALLGAATVSLLPFGLEGIAFGLVISAVVVFITGQTIINRMTGLTYRRLWTELKPVIGGVAAIMLSVGLFQYWAGFYLSGHFSRLIGAVAVGVAAYGAALYWSRSPLTVEIWSLAFGTIKGMSSRALRAGEASTKEMP